jgi:hypothetical protein
VVLNKKRRGKGGENMERLLLTNNYISNKVGSTSTKKREKSMAEMGWERRGR